MKTQIELAREGVITSQMEKVAVDEDYSPEVIRQRVAEGEIVIPNNPNRPDQIVRGIGYADQRVTWMRDVMVFACHHVLRQSADTIG